MFKKREAKGKGLRRKREAESSVTNPSLGIVASQNDNDVDDEGSAVVRDDFGNSRKRVNKFSTGNGTGGFSKNKAKNGNGHLGALLAVESEGNKKHEYGGSATATNDIDTEADHDARAIAEKNLLMQNDGGGLTEDGTKLYRGQAGYKNYIAKDEASIGNNKNTGTQGPIRAPAFFRTTCRFDYQPDICKDYTDTGFCGFGDSCKFMHDRGNYKSGYQMEKEWDDKQAERKRMIAMGIDPDEDKKDGEDDEFSVKNGPELPFACFICRGPFQDPIQTICQHYFCQKCAVKQFRSEGPNCPICMKNTSGIFNGCRKLTKYANSKGGFLKLFAQESGNEDGTDSLEANAAPTDKKEETPINSKSILGGSWGVVEDEEGDGLGVGDLLHEEEEKKEGETVTTIDNKTQNNQEEESNSKVTTKESYEQQAKLYELAKSIGWYQVTAHGQTYWFHQASNMTSREVPPQIIELLNENK